MVTSLNCVNYYLGLAVKSSNYLIVTTWKLFTSQSTDVFLSVNLSISLLFLFDSVISFQAFI